MSEPKPEVSMTREEKTKAYGQKMIQLLEEVLFGALDLKGEERDATARYCAILVTDLEKLIPFVAVHIAQLIPKVAYQGSKAE